MCILLQIFSLKKNIILEYLVFHVASKSSLTSLKGRAPKYPPEFLVGLLLFLFCFPPCIIYPKFLEWQGQAGS